MLSEGSSGLRPLRGREPESVEDWRQRGIDAAALAVCSDAAGRVRLTADLLPIREQDYLQLADADDRLDAVGKTHQRSGRTTEVMYLVTLDHPHDPPALEE